MRTLVRARRLRGNPLRRRSDVVQAWTALLVAVLLAVAVPLIGVVAGLAAQERGQDAALAQRAERHQVRAVVTGGTVERRPRTHGDREHPYLTEVRFGAPGGRTHTALARVPAGTRAGSVVHVWFDARDRAVAPPPDDVAVWQHSVTVGVGAAGGAAALVLLGNAAQRRIALRHRLAEWERDWERTGPKWTRPRT